MHKPLPKSQLSSSPSTLTSRGLVSAPISHMSTTNTTNIPGQTMMTPWSRAALAAPACHRE
jgi:hypothetical protein